MIKMEFRQLIYYKKEDDQCVQFLVFSIALFCVQVWLARPEGIQIC
jgi:hypothetical protein